MPMSSQRTNGGSAVTDDDARGAGFDGAKRNHNQTARDADGSTIGGN